MIYEARVTGVYAGKYWVNIPAKFGTQDVGPIDAAPTIAPAIGDYVYVGELPVSGSFLLLTGKDPSPVPVQWADIAGKPATFPSTWATVSGKPTTFAPAAHTHLWADLTDKPSTFTPSAHTHFTVNGGPAVLGLYSNGGGYYSVDGVTKMAINLDGGITSSAAPSIGAHLANKTYVDAQVATRALSSHAHTWAEVTGKPTTFTPSAHVHSGADITSGTISDARIANATASLDGLMPKADKAKLDAATSSPTASTVAMRDVNGGLQVIMPAAGINYVANRAYVDAGDAGSIKQSGDNGSTHLNTINTVGQSYTTASANVTPANGYPINGTAGELDVRPFHGTRPAAWVIQEWTQWSPFRKWGRASSNATAATPTWSAWVEITSQVATSLIAGLMSPSDKAKLDASTASNSNSTLVMRDPTGHVNTSTPTSGTHAANMSYVDSTFLGLELVSMGSGQNLNDYTTTGRFYQGNNNAAAGGTNYPGPFAGRLLVDGTSTFTWQEYTFYASAGAKLSGVKMTRARYNSTWTQWTSNATDAPAVWETIPISGTSYKLYDSALPIKISESGGWVNLNGAVTVTANGNANNSNAVVAGLIPSKYMPPAASQVMVWRCQASNNDSFGVTIEGDGRLNINRYGPGTGNVGVWLPFNVSWKL